jgi:hypothetical protein
MNMVKELASSTFILIGIVGLSLLFISTIITVTGSLDADFMVRYFFFGVSLSLFGFTSYQILTSPKAAVSTAYSNK